MAAREFRLAFWREDGTTGKRPSASRTNRSRSGFSLTEMLATTLIVLLVSAVVATGVSAAVREYRSVTFASQSQVLADSLRDALSTPLRFKKVDNTGVTSVDYLSYTGDAAIKGPSITLSDGTLGLTGTVDGVALASPVDLVNGGSYGSAAGGGVGDCTVTELRNASGSKVDSIPIGPGDVSGSFVVSNASGLSATYDFAYHAVSGVAMTEQQSNKIAVPDNPKPTVSAAPSTVEFSMTSLWGWEWSQSFSWQQMTDTNSPGINYLACKNNGTALIWYDNRYYKAVDQNGADSWAGINENTNGDQFKVADLTDGQYHTYQWSDNTVRWVDVTPASY